LAPLLERYLRSEWASPVHAATVEAFNALVGEMGDSPGPLILDSGCGTGESTRRLAKRFPGSMVIGIDKSADRLARLGSHRFPRREGNAVWLRAELATFWRLALAAGWQLERHFLFYPNPWPKPGQLQRRWHAHPVFLDMLRLGGRLEMRCNWKVYADEFAFALNRLTDLEVSPQRVEEGEDISPFERKYRASGHELYSVVISLQERQKPLLRKFNQSAG
jgi:tRNA G46 methylase TrmB